ncbi:amino acid adenylation domain-containing protein [Catellatospora methionotrophica]|uniref:amino acid adenylation domain-containing protein n=1 Tax=Catellatospora methionotrophica TaxID=121620 RepID=UPI0033FE921C
MTVVDLYGLTPVQAGILFHAVAEPDQPAYLNHLQFELHGPVDAERLADAFTWVTARHDILRTSYHWAEADEPLAAVHDAIGWRPALHDVTADSDPSASLRRIVARRLAAPMDPAEPGLTRLDLIRFAPGRLHVLWTHHHLVLDGWSLATVFGEAMRRYRDGAAYAPPPAPQFGGHVAWLADRDRAATDRHWRTELVGAAPTVLAVPRSGAGDGYGRHVHTLDAAATAALTGLARDQRVTLATIVQTGWALALSRYADTDDVVFGATVAGRPAGVDGIESTVGMFINTVPVRVTVAAGQPAGQLLHTVLRGQAARAEHEHAALTDVNAAAGLGGGRQLFDTLLVVENFPLGAAADAVGDGLTMVPVRADEHTHYPVTVTVLPGDSVRIELDHRRDTVADHVAAGLLDLFAQVLERLVADPGQPADRLADTPEPAPHAPVPPGPTVVDLFLDQARRSPQATAVRSGAVSLSYAELERQSAVLAGWLADQGAGAGTVVALRLPSGPELAAAVLGVLRCGAAYLPLDPFAPAARAADLAARAGAVLRLDSGDVAAALDGAGAAPAVVAPAPPSAAANAYTVFTSGSTGEPKAVVVGHAALGAHAAAIIAEYGLDAADRVLQFTNPAFDVAAEELFPTWAAGATVVCAPDRLPGTVEQFCELLSRTGVSVVNLPAAYWHLWVEELSRTRLPQRLRLLVVGNEPVWTEQLRQWREHVGDRVQLRNAYGTTETTITTTVYRPGDDLPTTEMLPIGTPLPGMRARLLDRRLRPVPDGVVGELYVGGTGVAVGYLGDPARTAASFGPDPQVTGGRLYRTGDLAYRLPDGALVLTGRADEQVQIRGHRVEPAEVEAAVAGHPAVAQVAVLAHGGTPQQPPYLIAHVAVPDDATLDGVRAHVAQVLPDHLRPARWARWDTLPLLPTGKIDRVALAGQPPPAPSGADTAEPATATEQWLADTWREVLGVPVPSRDADFFDLGGHSLAATQVTARIRRAFDVALPVAAVLAARRLATLARILDQARRDQAGQPLPALRPTAAAPVASFTQERLWLLDQLGADGGAYNVPAAWLLTGPVDAAALRRAFAAIVARHAVLRSSYPERGGRPAVRVRAHVPVDLIGSAAADEPGAIRSLLAAEAQRPFDLADGPLFRFRLVSLGPHRHLLVINVHHIVFDGWSHALLMGELADRYAAELTGTPAPAAPLPVQYADYAAWQRSWLDGAPLERLLGYWREALDGLPEQLELPTDRPRSRPARFDGAAHQFAVPAAVADGLRTMARDADATLFTVLLAGYAALLHRYSGQPDLAVGTPVAGRLTPETEQLIGCFFNTLTLRSRLTPATTFTELVDRLRQVVYGALDHQEAPFEKVVEAVTAGRRLDRPPVVQVMFVYQNTPHRPLRLSGLDAIAVDVPEAAKYDLTLTMAEQDGRLLGRWEYNAALFDTATVEQLSDTLVTLLSAAAAAPDSAVADLPLLTPGQQRRQLATGTGPVVGRAPGVLPRLLRDQVTCTPEAVAVRAAGRRLTYRELDVRTDALARRLREHGVRRGDLVGVCVRPGTDLPMALWAVLKAGAAYVPLDPAAPPGRQAAVCTQADVALVLAQPDVVDVLAEVAAPVLTFRSTIVDNVDLAAAADPAHDGDPTDAVWAATAADRAAQTGLAPPGSPAHAARPARGAPGPDTEPTPDDLAYVLFTSGSTGQPKGVAVTHGNVTAFLGWLGAAHRLGPGDRVLAQHSAGFDLSVGELFAPLLTGGTVVVAETADRGDPVGLLRLLRDERVTVMWATPTLLRLLTAGDGLTTCPDLRLIMSAGETLPADLARTVTVQTAAVLENQYGPTEATVGAARHLVARHHDQPTVPVGRVIDDMAVQVVDARGRLALPGAVGELHLTGPQLARGYHGAPSLTAQAFVPDPYATVPGARRYRTGDLGRLGPDGVLEHLGRLDRQLKVRGHRIEPGEVEAVLARHPAVTQAAVLAVGQRLVAFVAPATADPAAVQAHAARLLPPYLTPAQVTALAELPRTASGKTDLGALAALAGSATAPVDTTPPAQGTETEVAAILAAVLGVPALGAHDDFFATGGHSLLAVQAVDRLRRHFGVELPLRELFAAPTVAGLAARIEYEILAGADDTLLLAALQAAEAADDPNATRTAQEDQ